MFRILQSDFIAVDPKTPSPVSMVVVAAADIDIVVIDAAVACRHRCCGNNPL